jgi:Myotubularin-like phosphatase domain
MAAGKGTEDISLYPNAELIFCDIDNIHVMRASAQVRTV